MYQNRSCHQTNNSISKDTLNLIKFFISTNLAIDALTNPYLTRIIAPSIQLTSVTTFRYTILPRVMDLMKKEIASKCEDAISIILIPDGWTTPQMSEYLG